MVLSLPLRIFWGSLDGDNHRWRFVAHHLISIAHAPLREGKMPGKSRVQIKFRGRHFTHPTKLDKKSRRIISRYNLLL